MRFSKLLKSFIESKITNVFITLVILINAVTLGFETSEKLASKIVHNGMYALLIGTVLSGLLIGFLFWIELKDGIIIDIVILLHELNINLLYWLIGIHILAATYHRLKRDGVWSSMVPFLKEKNPK